MLRRIHEEEKEDDETSSSQNPAEALEEFRAQWVREVTSKSQKSEDQVRVDVEIEAKELFLKAVDLEQSGKMVEAIKHYRRALQLVPDIESKVYMGESNCNLEETVEHVSDEELDTITDIQDLLVQFRHLSTGSDGFCQPLVENELAHISDLPAEVVEYILRWVVSVELDVRSLCQVAQVCRGFYLFAEEQDLWKRICVRTWGPNCGQASWNGYASYKDMYINRPHLLFHGCYISKTTYIRQGENSFQDSEYQPWHVVQYFRLFRFFADGTVLMHTTGDELLTAVGALRSKQYKNPGILKGFYKIVGTRIVATMNRIIKVPIQVPSGRGKRFKKDMFETNQQFNEIELELKPGKNRENRQLVWIRYRLRLVYANGHESENDFEMNSAKFPALMFSRVKSYAQESEAPV